MDVGLILFLSSILIVILIAKSLGYVKHLALIQLGRLPAVQRHNADLSHQKIIDLLAEFALYCQSGVCYGFSLNWACAVAKEKDEVFYEKFNLIRLHQLNLKDIVSRVEEKKEKGCLLSETENTH